MEPVYRKNLFEWSLHFSLGLKLFENHLEGWLVSFRFKNQLERLAWLEIGKHEDRGTDRCAIHSPEAARWSATSPIRARYLQATLPGDSKSILPNWCQGKVVDLPLLSSTQCLPASLQGHLHHQSTGWALTKVYDHRVHPQSTRPNSTYIPICSGYVLGWRGPKGSARRTCDQFESFTAHRLSWTHHFWDHGLSLVHVTGLLCEILTVFYPNPGPSPWARLCRVPQVFRFPWYQGLLTQANPRHAGSRGLSTSESATQCAARTTHSACCHSIPASGPTSWIFAYRHLGAAAERSLARSKW